MITRLEHIDCPEKKQAFGAKAKQFTSDFIFQQNARVVSKGKKDRWGRLIAVLYNEQGKSLNKAIVENGLGMHFKRFSSDMSYDKLEAKARRKKTGMWSDPNIIEPWTYRKKR
ncbi:thermonuclease family protein [Mesonia algae]|uniref:thermonuclease family protein n=1 Tax=Mesonia algae TaxID=213248 RepID=UPI000DADB966|nr:thermonuclease family protein [Mesonia algae]